MNFLRYGASIYGRYFSGWASTVVARAVLSLWGASVGPGLKVHGTLRLAIWGELVLGSNIRINSGRRNFVGGDQRFAVWVGSGARVTIGDGCALSNSTLVALESIELLSGTFVGGGCLVLDSDHHALEPNNRLSGQSGPSRAVRIGPRAFVGAGVTVLKGATIGEAAVVGAGSVVTGVIPPGEIWAGVPARRVGSVWETGCDSH